MELRYWVEVTKETFDQGLRLLEDRCRRKERRYRVLEIKAKLQHRDLIYIYLSAGGSLAWSETDSSDKPSDHYTYMQLHLIDYKDGTFTI